MSEKRRISSNTLFWILHTAGWLLLLLVNIVLYWPGPLVNPAQLLTFFIRYSGGFLVSLYLRHVFRAWDYGSQSISSFLPRAVGSFFLAVHLWFVIDLVKDTVIFGSMDPYHLFYRHYLHKLLWNSMFLLCWSLSYFGVKLWMDWQQQKEKTEEARISAQNAQLQMLPYQLDPQFLFHSLDSIRDLIEENGERAKYMITDLAEFLRYSLISRRYPVVPLSWELDAMRHYMALVQEKRSEKLSLTSQIAPGAEDYPIYCFTLYTFLNWMIKGNGPAQVGIEAGIRDGALHLDISHVGELDEATPSDIANLRDRLETSYPDRHRLNIAKENGRTSIVIELDSVLEDQNGASI
jgi:LytS/YehU family sensor histidine kinase